MELGINYSQAEAPGDLSMVRSVVMARLQEEVDMLDSVRFSYTGMDMDVRSVGKRTIEVEIGRFDASGVLEESCLSVL